MNPAEIKQDLQRHFDEGRPIPAELRETAHAHPETRAYLEELEALEAALSEAPPEEPSEAFLGRLEARVAREQTSSHTTVSIAIGCVGLLSIGAVVVGWLRPEWARADTWLSWAPGTTGSNAWLYDNGLLARYTTGLGAQLQSVIEGTFLRGGVGWYAALVGALAVFLAVNAATALRVRGDDPNGLRKAE